MRDIWNQLSGISWLALVACPREVNLNSLLTIPIMQLFWWSIKAPTAAYPNLLAKSRSVYVGDPPRWMCPRIQSRVSKLGALSFRVCTSCVAPLEVTPSATTMILTSFCLL